MLLQQSIEHVTHVTPILQCIDRAV